MLSKISKLEKELAQIKLEIGKGGKSTKGDKTTKGAKTAKPKDIDYCESKEELNKFSLSELKEYIKTNKINVKKITEKHKADFVEIVWKYINENSDDSDDSKEESEEEEEEYEWYYYYS